MGWARALQAAFIPPVCPSCYVSSPSIQLVVQVIFALPPKGNVDYTMRIYNSDGSEPEMCGNGIRCLARFVAEKDNAGPRQYKVSTGAGQLACDFPSRTILDAKAPLSCVYYSCAWHILTYASIEV